MITKKETLRERADRYDYERAAEEEEGEEQK